MLKLAFVVKRAKRWRLVEPYSGSKKLIFVHFSFIFIILTTFILLSILFFTNFSLFLILNFAFISLFPFFFSFFLLELLVFFGNHFLSYFTRHSFLCRKFIEMLFLVLHKNLKVRYLVVLSIFCFYLIIISIIVM